MKILSQNIDLMPYNTFKVACKALFFAEFSSVEELKNAVNFARNENLPWYVIGGGSNVLFASDFRGLIIHPTSQKIEEGEENIVIAESGVEWDDFVEWSVENGYHGLENLSYIPGSVGASPVQNIGAYGSQAADSIEWVEYLDTQSMTIERIENKACGFGYRDSIFKRELKGRAIITRVAYRLTKNFNKDMAKLDYGDLRSMVENMEGGATLRNIRAAVTAIRKSKLPEPSEIGNAGSFFKNPVVSHEKFEQLKSIYPNIPSYDAEGGVKIPAGWLIDQAGFKGHRDGNVGVHAKQALVLVNYGGGTAKEILALADKIIKTIEEKYGVTIAMEVNVVWQ